MNHRRSPFAPGKPLARRTGLALLAGYVATIVLANWLVHRYGIVPVGFGLSAPAGVYAVALALVLRNGVQRQLGRLVAVAAIGLGAALSWVVADASLARASAVAFLLSELLDMAVYTPLRERGQLRAVLPASLLGAALDSLVFLWLTFGSEQFWSGQMLGKTYGVLAAALILATLEARWVELA